ncbi:hypothetical protein ACFHYO_06110 [Paracoccus panacisoli]|uniref:Uncharacterized protein n=1 Tax=Paracoccus panacisoli TaxID=1510163 RepID=A0ABV6T358_9RHOB|nr:hypothetical protein [Paracoccus sanguinis]
MNLALLLHCSAAEPAQSLKAARDALLDPAQAPDFSFALLWDLTGLDRPDFRFDRGSLRARALVSGYRKLAVKRRNILALAALPRHLADPLDCLRIAGAANEEGH